MVSSQILLEKETSLSAKNRHIFLKTFASFFDEAFKAFSLSTGMLFSLKGSSLTSSLFSSIHREGPLISLLLAFEISEIPVF